jgi:hypothetical protein
MMFSGKDAWEQSEAWFKAKQQEAARMGKQFYLRWRERGTDSEGKPVVRVRGLFYPPIERPKVALEWKIEYFTDCDGTPPT